MHKKKGAVPTAPFKQLCKYNYSALFFGLFCAFIAFNCVS